MRSWCVILAAMLSAQCAVESTRSALPARPEAAPGEIGWAFNGRDVYGTRYTPSAGITRENVGRLQHAWTYRTGQSGEQFIVVSVGGGGAWGTGDYVVAFKLAK